jgi:hypothetical protein
MYVKIETRQSQQIHTIDILVLSFITMCDWKINRLFFWRISATQCSNISTRYLGC